MHMTMQSARLVLLLLFLFLVAIAVSTPPLRAAPNIPGDEKWMPGPTLGGVNGRIEAMAIDFAGNLYIGGDFTAIGTLPARHIAKWNGSAWSALSYGLSGPVSSLAWDSLHHWLYVGGGFVQACSNSDCSSGLMVNFIARWDPATVSWSPLKNGLSGLIHTLAVDAAGDIYAAGGFTKICTDEHCMAAGPAATHIAMWNSDGAGSWSSLTDSVTGTEGVTGTVVAMAWWTGSFGSYLVAGGSITKAGGKDFNHIAMWSPGPKTWIPFWNGVDGSVYALAVGPSDEPGKTSIVVGGSFTNTCQMLPTAPACTPALRANNVAASKGFDWFLPLQNGLLQTGEVGVNSLAIDYVHKAVYVGGGIGGICTNQVCDSYTAINHIARWDYSGSGQWSAMGSGIDDYADALAWDPTSNLVYAGGAFSTAGGVATSGLAAWNGSAWSGFGSIGGVSPTVDAVAVDRSGRVYVGGDVKRIGSLTVNHYALWDPVAGTWSALGMGLDWYPQAMVVDSDGTLYVAGQIQRICGDAGCYTGGTPVNNVVKWTPNGSSGTWSSIGFGLDGPVYALALDRYHNLYAGGWYGEKICGDIDCNNKTPAANVIKWDGHTWSAVGDLLEGGVLGLAFDRDNNLYAGGGFKFKCSNAACATDGPQLNYIARLPAGGGTWEPVGNGVDGIVASIVVDSGNNVYAGGAFSHLCNGIACAGNTVNANNVAKWNGSWSALANGLNSDVTGMAVDDRGDLYAGGWFENLCGDSGCSNLGAPVHRIARWDGSNWTPLGSGIGPSVISRVSAVAYRSPYVIVGGYFATAGDKLSANVARYNAGASLFLPLVKR